MSISTRGVAFWSSVFCLLAAEQAAAIDYYTVDPAHTSIVFSVAHSGFSYTYGFFRKATGTYKLDKDNGANCSFSFTIDANSLDTNNQDRDKHLRSPDFFDVQQYPTITFQSTRCTASNTQDGVIYQLTGNLTIHGVTKQVNVPLRMLGSGPGPYKDQRTGFLCQIELKRTDFDMKNLLDGNLVGDAVGITVSFEGSQQQPGTAPVQ
ncbi:MAG TPA: YceI family protein [Lacipirellulaceae bacterium]|nr:YceI family protein [Lacipirellulaceae bacterium]